MEATRRHAISVLLLLLIAVALMAFRPQRLAQAATATPTGGATATTPGATVSPTAAATPQATVAATPTIAVAEPAPTALEGEPCAFLFQEAWAASGHADASAVAFTYWSDDTPAQVPPTCARCHSTEGYIDYLGDDGTSAGTVEQAAPVESVITCNACHSPGAFTLTSVTFPSGDVVTDPGPSGRCMICHQGRASTVQVDAAIERAGVAEDDETNPDLGFVNIHYYAAAATLFGSEVRGGYQYEGARYHPQFEHVAGFNSCAGCHSPHTLQLDLEACAQCHDGVESVEDLRDIRMQGSQVDYDGDGDLDEGIYYEIEGLRELLLEAIETYAVEIAGTAIAYTSDTHPYFFIDTNEDGEADEDEAVRDNRYNAFSPRLLKAAYNFQVSLKDPGAFAHNGKYIIQLLYDSIASLNDSPGQPDLASLTRDDFGHFDPTAQAFRHWDEDETGVVPAGCAKCHSADGLPFFVEHNVSIRQPISASLACSSCHSDMMTFAVYQTDEVVFPSGAALSLGEEEPANVCLNCHQGRESTVSISQAIQRAGVGDDEVSETLRFRNPHYFAAGATLFGTEARGAYEYEGQEYNGRFVHVARFDTCNECHEVHQLTVNVEACGACHDDVETAEDLRTMGRMGPEVDYDGDGDAEEGIAGEIETMHEALLEAIQTYAAETIETPIAFSAAAYPYWFTDTDASGEAEEEEAVSDNGYASWTPRLLRAAYNYTWVAKDPGAFAHNNLYVIQFLYDSLADIGGEEAVADMTRPPASD